MTATLNERSASLPATIFEPAESDTSTGLRCLLLMDRLVDLLVEKTKSGIHWPDLYAHAEQMVAMLSVSTPTRYLAYRRLRNAKAYADEGVFSAAAIELRMLRTQLA